MSQLAVFATIFFTVVLALAVGVGLGFTCINTILHFMGHRTQPQLTEATVHGLQTAEVSGD